MTEQADQADVHTDIPDSGQLEDAERALKEALTVYLTLVAVHDPALLELVSRMPSRSLRGVQYLETPAGAAKIALLYAPVYETRTSSRTN